MASFNQVAIAGLRFGKIVAVQNLGSQGTKSAKWLWQCDCGETAVMHKHTAKRQGHCGCQTAQRMHARFLKHGMSGTNEYKAWAAMKDRCLNPNNKHFADYGGRGISVCERWAASFELFREDMGPRPDGMTIDRINNDGNYEPGNCRWATRREQQRNRRSNVTYEIDGQSKCLAEWCFLYGIPRATVVQRIHAGWQPAVAITTKSNPQHRNRIAKEPVHASV